MLPVGIFASFAGVGAVIAAMLMLRPAAPVAPYTPIVLPPLAETVAHSNIVHHIEPRLRVGYVTVAGEFACSTSDGLKQLQRCIAHGDAVGFESLFGTTCMPVPGRLPVSVFAEVGGAVDVAIKDFAPKPGTRWWMSADGIEPAPEEREPLKFEPDPGNVTSAASARKADRGKPSDRYRSTRKPSSVQSGARRARAARHRYDEDEESDYEMEPVEPYEDEDEDDDETAQALQAPASQVGQTETAGSAPEPKSKPATAPSAAPATARNDTPPPVRVPPRVVYRPEASYPDDAPRTGTIVEVRLSILVGVEGAVTDTKLIRGAGGAFDREAQRIALRLRFEPGTVSGVPTPMWVPWPVVFEPY